MKSILLLGLALVSINQTFASEAPYVLPECTGTIVAYNNPASLQQVSMKLAADGSRTGSLLTESLGKVVFKVKETQPGNEEHPVSMRISRVVENNEKLLVATSGDMFSMKAYVFIDIGNGHEAAIKCTTGYDD